MRMKAKQNHETQQMQRAEVQGRELDAGLQDVQHLLVQRGMRHRAQIRQSRTVSHQNIHCVLVRLQGQGQLCASAER